MFRLVNKHIHSLFFYSGNINGESVWCKVMLTPGVYLSVGAFYRPPWDRSNKPFVEVPDVLHKVFTDYLLLGGDFNMPDVCGRNGMPMSLSQAALSKAFGE